MYAIPYAFANLGAQLPNPPQPLDLAEFDANFAFLFNPAVVNALKAGCKGDGTDDTAAINAIVASGARVIYFPWTPSGYGFGPTLVKTAAANCAFVGDPCRTMFVSLAGRGNVSMIANPTSDPADNAHRDTNIAFVNLLIVGDKGSGDGEQSHCIALNAVNSVRFDNVMCRLADADGVYFGSASSHQAVGCSGARGSIITEDCGRQGVTVICGDSFDLNVYSYRSHFAGFDGELNNSQNFIKNSRFYVYAEGCSAGGGVSVGFDGDGGTGGGTISDIDIAVTIVGGLSDGFSWRHVTNMSVTGRCVSPVGNGFVGAVGNSAPSTIRFNVSCSSPGASGMSARGTGDIIDTTFFRVTGATQVAFDVENGGAGTWAGLEITNNGGAGVMVYNTNNVTMITPKITDNLSTGLWIRQNSTGTTVQGGSILRNKFNGLLIASGCTGNNLINTDISGTVSGNDINDSGTGNVVQLRPLAAIKTWSPGSIASGATATTTITCAGISASKNYNPTVTLGISLSGWALSYYISASNTITVNLTNTTGGSVDPGAIPVQATVSRIFAS